MGKLTHRTHPGCTYFVTTNTWANRAVFHVAANAEILVQAIFHYREQDAYLLHEFVVMPNHLHLMLTPSQETTLEKAMQLIKGGSSHQIHQERGHKMQIWQSGFHEWTVRDEKDYRAKVEYIRMNPVEARLVERPEEWLYGSANGGFRLDPMPRELTSGAKAL